MLSAAAPDDFDETGRLRGVHQVADVGSGHAEAIGHFDVRDLGGQISRIEGGL